MVKFLPGGSYSGEAVPVCAYWREDLTTNKDEDHAPLTSEGVAGGSCIANAYFTREQITCFNDGECNGEGKCLPCSQYKYGGLRLGISHSPPLDILRQFDKGLSEADVQSPNLVKFPTSVVTQVNRDQLPFHIVLRNVQATIAKCCHWNQGDGAPTQFYLATIIGGPDQKSITDLDGNVSHLVGINVTNPAFPDQVGTFFPVGTTVVAGWEGQPSFYLEPRTGLIKPGDGVIYQASGAASPLTRIKQAATSCTQPLIDTVRATGAVCNDLNQQLQRDSNFYNNALNTNDPALVAAAEAKADDTLARRTTACDAATDATTAGNTANSIIGQIVATSDVEDAQALSVDLTEALNEIATLAETASSAGTGSTASKTASAQAARLRRQARNLETSSSSVSTKCEFFYASSNVAEQWNSPIDGSLPCNGVRTGCQYYTGEPWTYATDEKLEIGQRITGQALQEIRWRSADWEQFSDPEETFRQRFSTPFIWAFTGYVDSGGTPDIEDMLLYRPSTLFARNTDLDSYETIEVTKIEISDFENFEVTESKATIQPGSEVLDVDRPPSFPTIISRPLVPSTERLQIKHPIPDQVFKYRTWSPDKNKISLFGISKPNGIVYIVNATALARRNEYNDFTGVTNFVDDLPTSIPGAPSFTPGAVPASTLEALFLKLYEESRINPDAVMLGFDRAETDRTGFWQSTQTVDLVHNERNTIYAFLLQDTVNFLVDRVDVDYTFMHSIPVQTSFAGTDFTIHDSAGNSQLGSVAINLTKVGKLSASTQQVAGNEEVGFGYGYYGRRFRDRNLRFGNLTADNDLIGDAPIADEDTNNLLVTETGPSQIITSVGYHVVQYRKSDVVIEDWYLINDCGFIMIVIPDIEANRVLPLPDQAGNVKPLSNVLLNGGGRGAIIAQFAIESATLTIDGQEKTLVQYYRDEDGFGLPANYVILGPAPEVENAFGRPIKEQGDSVKITYTYLQAQSAGSDNLVTAPEKSDEVVNDNFYADRLRGPHNAVEFTDSGGLLAGGDSPTAAITSDEQAYVWVFTDSEGRPIGRKYSRLLVMYYSMTCINVEMFYSWRSTCTTYGLTPDLFANIGQADGTVTKPPKGTIDPAELSLGHRVANLLGEKDCGNVPSCGDHEYLQLGPLRREFEVIVNQTTGTGPEATTVQKAAFPSAGGAVSGQIVIAEPPGSQFLRRRGPLWYPYIICERPRYNFRTNGPLHTDSTELINEEVKMGGLSTGTNVIEDKQVAAGGGEFGALMRQDLEAYQGPNRVVPRILDTHPSARQCSIEYTYGNQVLTGRTASFNGYARRRGEIDRFWYTGLAWTAPPFGNFGRPRLSLEVASKRGDFLGGQGGQTVGFRWMPMFPEREDIGATLELFSENLEPQQYRLIQSANPAGSISEVVQENTRYSHKELIQNRVASAIEYPYVQYYPTFLPNASLGSQPESRTELEELGTISTMWAWREQERPVSRGVSGSTVLKSIKLQSPDYFIDQRRLEVQLRPDEGLATLTFTAPSYDFATGALVTNASLQLNDGPVREIIIDFANRTLQLATQADTVYDTSKVLGDDPFPCSENTPTDNPRLESLCSCIGDADDASLEGPPTKLPAIFQHLDSLAPDGYAALYESTDLRPPFSIPLSRATSQEPCCMCVYYIRGMFFGLDLEALPAVSIIDPAFSSLIFRYTWSRVPHGLRGGVGRDGAFDATEPLADNYLSHSAGAVFTNRFIPGANELTASTDVAAVFPSRQYALQASADEEPIQVIGLDAEDLKPGAVPTAEGESRGEDEPIVLDFAFNTFVKITRIAINFAVGRGWAVPTVKFGIIDPSLRTGSKETLRTSRIVTESTTSFAGTGVPNAQFFPTGALQEGLEEDRGGLYTLVLTPAYANEPFWNQYGQEFHLIFGSRDGINSMGIAGIELTAEAMLPGSETSEIISIPARKYYVSTGSPSGGINPEEKLSEVDSATVYWRTQESAGATGSNKFRAYAWGAKIEDGQEAPLRGEAQELEKLQEAEYDKARNLFPAPYTYTFSSYIPKDEREAIDFYGGNQPSWSLSMQLTVSPVKDVRIEGGGNQLYGEVPNDRRVWHAPGHAWTYRFIENYLFCCDPCPKQMTIDYNYAHLHDSLAVVETARFWDELPSGFTKLIRSTMMAPDVTFGQQQESGTGITGGTSGRAVLLSESDFVDSQGNAISVEVLEASGFAQAPDGSYVIVSDGDSVGS